MKEKSSALEKLKSDVYCGGFMMELAKEYPTVLSNARSSFTQEAVQYLDELVNPSYQKQVSTSSHCHFIGLPSSQYNVAEATPCNITELGSLLKVNGPKLWKEFISYKSFVESLQPKTLHQAVFEMWHSTGMGVGMVR